MTDAPPSSTDVPAPQTGASQLFMHSSAPQRKRTHRRVKRPTFVSEQANASLLQLWGASPALEEPRSNVPCVDLFACIGGWSTGATQAGHRVVLAVDNDPEALAVHALNHPETAHLELTLGPETEEILVAAIREALTGDGVWHLHGSPPCTTLSNFAFVNADRDHDDVRERVDSIGCKLVEWFLDLVLKLKPSSWSFEQVRHKKLLETLGDRRRRHPDVYDYEVVDMWHYGVPQTRTRLIAGSPHLMQRLRSAPGLRVAVPITIRDVLPEIPEDVRYMREHYNRGSKPELTVEYRGRYYNPEAERRCRTLNRPAYTILTRVESHAWWDAQFRLVRRPSISEYLALQTFPADYRFPDDMRHGARVRGVGNAYPPLLSQKLLSDYRRPERKSEI